MQALDERNTERLKSIVALCGWPTRRAVGEPAATAAWLIVQHSPDLDFQKRCLTLMRHAATQGQAAMRNVAYLEDRVLVREGKPQTYGTQVQPGRAEPFLIRDQDRVEQEDRDHMRFMLEAEQADAVSAVTRDHGLGWMTRRQWWEFHDLLPRYQALDRELDVEQVFTARFLEAAYQDGRLVWP
jgi:hypothetical protein